MNVSHDADVLVVGSGHNALVAAGYLATAGKRVVVLERNEFLGGGVASGELTEPGFVSDRHALFHLRILANPLIVHDELGLRSRYGLDYLPLDPPYSAIFTDGTHVPVGRDRAATMSAIAEFSPRDAEAYGRFCARATEMVEAMSPGLFVPPPADPAAQAAALGASPLGRHVLRTLPMSVAGVLAEWFTDDRVLIALTRMASELTLAHPDTPGTGSVAYLAVGLAARYGAALPRGGGSTFTEACVRCIVDHGGEVRTGVDVTRILTRSGRVTGVRTADGAELRAGDAVLAGVHPHHLGAVVEDLDPALAKAAAATTLSACTAFVVHAALDRPLRFRGDGTGGDAGAVWNTLSDPDLATMNRSFDDVRHGRRPAVPLLEAGVPSIVDPTRAPEGKAVLHMLALTTRDLADGGPQRWETIKEDVADALVARLAAFAPDVVDAVRSRALVTPLDHERTSASFVGGDYTGIAQIGPQMGGARPIPDLAGYAVPGVEGLYLTGPFMHPGGGVVGGGRATAVRMFGDLGLDRRLFAAA